MTLTWVQLFSFSIFTFIAYVADWKVSLSEGQPHETKDHSTENFLKQVEETASYIGEYVNLYQVHSATFSSGVLSDSRVHQALADCRKERGWSIGLSVSGPDQDAIVRQAMTIQVDGKKLFDSVQCTFNIFEQKPGPVLQEAADAGMDIIIKEGMANGRVFQNKKLVEYAEETSCEVDQLALGYILAQAFQPRVLSGAVTAEQLTSNLKAMDVANKLTEDTALMKSLSRDCVVESEQYWSDRSALSWN
jgi:aryl-alcohol dehydrogenase-like predicted oxidoreductase